MDEILLQNSGVHNLAALDGIRQFREKVASAYEGQETTEVVDQFLAGIDSNEVFDAEAGVPEKTASMCKEAGIDGEKLAELEAQGRVFAHALINELHKFDKMASFVREELFTAFQAAQK